MEISNKKYDYSSLQVNLDLTDQKEIKQFVDEFINLDDVIKLENFYHITVRYGIHSNQADDIIKVVKLVQPIKAVLGKTSVFTNDEFDVVKIDVLSKDLRALNKLLRQQIEGTDTYPIYVPHLTLAYLRSGLGAKYAGNKTFEGRQVAFDRIVFSPSEGEDVTIFLNTEIPVG